MNATMKNLFAPNGETKYLFFGGKGGVGKTTVSTATAVWFADHGYRTTIVSTDPTVSLSAIFAQAVGGEAPVPIHEVKNLCGVNINPQDAKGVFQARLNTVMSQVTGALGGDMVSTPFDWAGFLEKQISEGKELARLMNMDERSLEGLERDKQRYERALSVLRN